MSGFGSGNFGNESFGQAAWAKRVLYDLLPDIYKNQDLLNNNELQKFSESIQPSFELLRQKIEKFNELREPLKVQTQYNDNINATLGKIIKPKGEITQKGIDGTVNSFGEFVAKSARFSHTDLNRSLFISRSDVPANNKEIKIVSIIDNKTVITVPSLSAATKIFRWEIRENVITSLDQQVVEVRKGDVSTIYAKWNLFDGTSTNEIVKRNIFTTPSGIKQVLTEREGADGYVDSQGRFAANTLKLTAKDIGKYFTISGSSNLTNNGKFTIIDIDVISATENRIVLSRIYFQGQDLNGGVVYTVKNGQESIRVTHIKTGVNTALSVEINDNTDIIVTLATDFSGEVNSTAAEVVSLINADPFVSLLVTATATGDGSGLSDEYDYSDPQDGILLEDSGYLTWAILPYPQLTIHRGDAPIGIVEQEGIDLSINLSSVTSATANFTSLDIGKCLSITGSTTQSNNGFFTIVSVTSANTVVLDRILTNGAESLCWELRSYTKYGTGTQVKISPPSFIFNLGKDFDLDVDEREVELRQRNYVNNCNQWFDKKGHPDSYKILGKISGFDVSAFPLFRISRNIAVSGITGLNVVETSESGTGRLGTDGSILYQSTGDFWFYSPTAAFLNTDISSCIKIRNADTSSNNTLFTVVSIINVNTILLNPVEAPLVDFNNGSLKWGIFKEYSTVAPTIPNYDEINSDLLTTLVGTPTDYPEFTVDKFCFETDMVDYVPITIDNSLTSTKFLYTNRIQIQATGEFGVVSSIGNWFVEDNDGNKFYLETLPVETSPGSGEYRFEAIETILPVAGGFLKYDCPTNILCDFCAASKVYLTIEANSVLADKGIALEKILQRLLVRFKDVTPIHVSLVTNYIQPIEVSFNMSVTIAPNAQILDGIIIPFGAYFDMIPADSVPADTQIFVTVDPDV